MVLSDFLVNRDRKIASQVENLVGTGMPGQICGGSVGQIWSATFLFRPRRGFSEACLADDASSCSGAPNGARSDLDLYGEIPVRRPGRRV